MIQLKTPLILALDVDDKDQALGILNATKDYLGAVKIGPRLGYKYGADFIKEFSETCPVFVDNKYFDITSTMIAAVKASFNAGATFVTVHALCGEPTLKELAHLEKDLNAIRPFQVLVVTILTSWDLKDIPTVFNNALSIDQYVKNLAEVSYQAGLKGLVCSAHEIEHLIQKDHYVVTPGVRLFGQETSISADQVRVVTPEEALAKGAQAFVVGRAILSSKDPAAVAQKILEGLK